MKIYNLKIFDNCIGPQRKQIFAIKQAEKLKSREMKEGWRKNDDGWMKNDER